MQLSSADSLVLSLASAHATTPLDWVSWAADVTTATGALSGLVPANGQSNGTTDVTLVAAPAAGVVRTAKGLWVCNRDTIAHTVRMDCGAAGTRRRASYQLEVGEVLQYSDTRGWSALDARGTEKIGPVIVRPAPTLLYPPGQQIAALTAVRTITSTNTAAVYIGRADRAYSSITVRWRVTTAAATVTWAEVAIARGTPVLAGNPLLTRLGFTDVAGVITSTGQKSTVVALTGCAAGDDLWVLIGQQATTAGIIRGGVADDLQTGQYATVVTRPSTMAANTAFTLDGATVVPPWVAAIGA